MKTLLDNSMNHELILDKFIEKHLRCNHYNGDRIVDYINDSGEPFYLYVIDGDDWTNSDKWTDKKAEDFYINKYLFDISEYKDCVIKYADEFVIFSPKDISKELSEMTVGRESSVTIYTQTVNHIDGEYFPFIKEQFNNLIDLKKEGKGVIYYASI